MWGFADVGADTYVALGLVMSFAQGLTGLAFAFAGIVYILVGLAYTELAAAYPVAGGGQYFSARGLGDFWGFVAGSALLLDYTIDIALFSAMSAGYVNWFAPYLFGIDIKQVTISLGPFEHVRWFWCAETLVLIALLIGLNIRGMRESSLLNEIVGIAVIAIEAGLVLIGFGIAFHPELVASQWHFDRPSLNSFMYGTSLAIISFVGLESISQAAQETRRPATIVPRTSIALIFTVFIFAVAFSCLGLGVHMPTEHLPASNEMVRSGVIADRIADRPWEVLGAHKDNPIARMASAMPYVGVVAGPLTALLGALVLLISANSGVMSASRLTFSMSRFQFISRWFAHVHPRHRTPVRTIWVFSAIGAVQTVLSFLSEDAIDTMGNMYAFGASTGYILVFVALMRLRFTDPYTPRPYKMPGNVRWKRNGVMREFPVTAILGTLGISMIWVMVVWTHEIGRIAGPAWIALCFIYYAWYRRKSGLPIFRSVPRDWEAQQMQVLAGAEEFDLLEQYRYALADRGSRKEDPGLRSRME
jgi:APA family basic amino acid/polyamine antiporter